MGNWGLVSGGCAVCLAEVLGMTTGERIRGSGLAQKQTRGCSDLSNVGASDGPRAGRDCCTVAES